MTAEPSPAYGLPTVSPGPHPDLVVVDRSALLELFGKHALPPWKDADGTLVGGEVDCAPLAEQLIADLDAICVPAGVLDQPLSGGLQELLARHLPTEEGAES